MLCMLEINKNHRKTKIKDITFFNQSIRVITIPNDKPRKLKTAAKIIASGRVIVWDGAECEKLLKANLNPVLPQRIFKYVTDKIFIKASEMFGISRDARVNIYTGRVGNTERRCIDVIAKNSRHIAVNATNLEETRVWLEENYGISALSNMKDADITICMYEENFGFYIMKKGYRYMLKDLEFEIKGGCEIPDTHIKSAYVALLSAGVIKPNDVEISNLRFRCEKLT